MREHAKGGNVRAWCGAGGGRGIGNARKPICVRLRGMKVLAHRCNREECGKSKKCAGQARSKRWESSGVVGEQNEHDGVGNDTG